MPRAIVNFGRNVRFSPRIVATPADAAGVLACLDQYRGRNVRAIGRLHSWSEAPCGDDVVLDLRRLDQVQVGVAADGTPYADIQAGCTVDAALAYVGAHGDFTLPVHGIVGRQTIAGAIATATHGAGRPSMSHYVHAVSVAGYDPLTGRARLFEWNDGDALRAARCSLGCLGVVVSVRMRLVRDYLVEERNRWFDRLADVISQEREYPRQQFYLVPWSWRWYAQLRRELPWDGQRPGAIAVAWQRAFRMMGVDLLLNGMVRTLAVAPGTGVVTRWFFRRAFTAIAREGMGMTDRSAAVFKMRHHLYRHIEMELFVPAHHVHDAAAFVEWALRTCGGEAPVDPPALRAIGPATLARVRDLRGTYVHGYPITFRRVLRDDAMLSMTSGRHEAWYAISLLGYQLDHEPFLRVAQALARAMAPAYGARPHWGKLCPLEQDEVEALYPELPRFRAHCAAVDREAAFVNAFGRRTLGLNPSMPR
jgi:FAD/FMN-containing dehydrogenase